MKKWHKFKINLSPEYIQSAIKKFTNIDYFRVNSKNIHPHYSEIMENIKNTTNSNMYYDGDYAYQNVNLSMWSGIIISTVYENKPVPIMLYNEFDEKTQRLTGVKSRIDFYGLYFRLELLNGNQLSQTIENMKEFILCWEFQWINQRNISRIDVSTDFFFNEIKLMPTIDETLSNVKWEKNIHIGKDWLLESWSNGSKDTLGIFYRGYNKNLDTLSKWKWFLYNDYLRYWSVHRIELQFGSRSVATLWRESINQLICEIEDATNWPTQHNISTHYQYKAPVDAHFEVNSYAKDIAGRAATYANNGYNPFMMLKDLLPQRISQKRFDMMLADFYLSLHHYYTCNPSKLQTVPSATVPVWV